MAKNFFQKNFRFLGSPAPQGSDDSHSTFGVENFFRRARGRVRLRFVRSLFSWRWRRDAWAEWPHGGGSLTHGLLDVVLQSAGHSFLDVLLDCGGNLFVCDHLRNADSLD